MCFELTTTCNKKEEKEPMILECGACGKDFKWPRKVNFCARCQISFMDWQTEKMDGEFDRLFGDLELSAIEEGSRKRKIKEEFTPMEWMT
ncbi:hypothetical protein GTO27_04375, partial [Candidatus Bathyarchaeota archaeon]|nr:hypothetical protein [Candidatus Bathyarchaeota archaeon]